eukprot:1158428-Pelagomonas_calceolata.AAC.4
MKCMDFQHQQLVQAAPQHQQAHMHTWQPGREMKQVEQKQMRARVPSQPVQDSPPSFLHIWAGSPCGSSLCQPLLFACHATSIPCKPMKHTTVRTSTHPGQQRLQRGLRAMA